MRREIQAYLAERPDLNYFIRMNPAWYRRLGRRPYDLRELEQEAKLFYGQTFAQKVDRFNEKIDMMNFAFGMLAMLSSNEMKDFLTKK